ncbi:MAG TPA: hypothetical protein VJ464_18465 [Blastocatellia bacterium]|nr:hypothetical protein [Blastocatellia bacterium]
MRSMRYLAVLIIFALFSTACVKKVKINELLPVNAPVSLDELVGRVNAYSEITTLAVQVQNVVVRNYFTGKKTEAEQFPAAAGLLRFRRPDDTRMRVTFIGKKIADMVSDGKQFRLAIYYPDDKRRFIHGSNLKDIDRMNAQDVQQSKDSQISRAGGLINMRPQHITDSFLIKPISTDERHDVFREEVHASEPDTRPGRSGRMVEKTYYVVYVIERGDHGQAKLRRKFWFDRTLPDTPLTRQQVFENGEGRLASDVKYSDWFKLPNSERQWPGLITIDRRNDGYRLELELAKDSIETNIDLPPTTFQLENDEHLEELDLDAPRKDLRPKNADGGEPASKPPKSQNANHR